MTEPGWVLRLVLHHFGSGDALWVGWFLLLLGVWGERRQWLIGRVIAIELVGWFWIGVSAWPAPVLCGVLFAAWLLRRVLSQRSAWAEWSRLGFVVLITVLAVDEFRYRWVGSLDRPLTSVSVIGDSVTAGLNDRERTWLQMLAETSSLEIRDVSQQGATVKSAHQQFDQLAGRAGLLVLEIGGNDVLESVPVDGFAEDYQRLMERATRQFERIIVVELPLPPFSGGYGVVQRHWARHPRVIWLPKREFIGVLTTRGSTVDGIHLSRQGQHQLAELFGRMMGL